MFIFPAHLFNPKEVNARVVQKTISGGVALSGDEDVIVTDGGGRWRIDYSGIELRTPAQQRAWSAWQGYLAGGAAECLVPLLSLVTAPRPVMWKSPARPSALYTDDDVFPEEVRFSAPYIVASTTGSAALRATSIGINVSKGVPIAGGEIFSVGERAHRIIHPTATATYQIEPPLRGAVSGGAPVNFEWPVVRCRMAPDDFSAPISRGRFSQNTISFLEAL